MEQEIWKDIKGYENLYQVSSMGRVRSLNKWVNSKNGSLRKVAGKILKCKSGKDKYVRVFLCKNSIKNVVLVHRLVASHFIPNPENKPYIDHIDTNPHNNNIDNLRWVTQRENCNNPISKAKLKDYYSTHAGSKHHCAKKIIQFSIDGQFIKLWGCESDVKRELGIGITGINRVLNGKRQTSGGYIWKYYNTFFLGNMIYTIKTRVA